MEKAVKIFFWLFIIGGIALPVIGGGRLPSYYNPFYMAVAAFLSAFALYVPVWMFRVKTAAAREACTRFQLMLAIVLAFNAAGALGLYKLYELGFQYDKFIHFINPALAVYGGTELLIAWRGMRMRSALIVSAVLVFIGVLAWEAFELFSDVLLGTATRGNYGDDVGPDTYWDIVMGVLGIAVAILFLSVRKARMT